MTERASLIWQSAAQLVEDALSKLLGNNMLFPDKKRKAIVLDRPGASGACC
jgi:hypothetical protein